MDDIVAALEPEAERSRLVAQLVIWSIVAAFGILVTLMLSSSASFVAQASWSSGARCLSLVLPSLRWTCLLWQSSATPLEAELAQRARSRYSYCLNLVRSAHLEPWNRHPH